MALVILAVFVLETHMISQCLYEHRTLSGINKDVFTTGQCGSQQSDPLSHVFNHLNRCAGLNTGLNIINRLNVIR